MKQKQYIKLRPKFSAVCPLSVSLALRLAASVNDLTAEQRRRRKKVARGEEENEEEKVSDGLV